MSFFDSPKVKAEAPSFLDIESLPVSPALRLTMKELGFLKLTPIQARSIPSLVEGKDLIGQSKTGSGKTLAYTIPILEKMDLSFRGVQALVLCPTRELCSQVAREVRKLGRRVSGLNVLVLSGGSPVFLQVNALNQGAQVVVGTPGRILDLLNRGSLDLSRAFSVVLDEADRMLDMGFQDDVERILSALPKKRQMVFFSATFPDSIHAMSRNYQEDPVKVMVEEDSSSVPEIRQEFYEVFPEKKLELFYSLLQQNSCESTIVFCNQKRTVMELTRFLAEKNLSVAGLQGDLEQRDRDRVLAKFRNRSTRILVATDVAARGLDIEDLDWVVNFDFPLSPENYVHRMGRTGRAGKKGVATSLVTSRELQKLRRIETDRGVEITQKTAPLSSLKSSDKVLADDAKYEAKMETLFIAGGRKEKVRPGDILGALTGEAGGLSADKIGKIEIHDHFSYVAISKDVSAQVLVSLREGRIKGRHFRVDRVR